MNRNGTFAGRGRAFVAAVLVSLLGAPAPAANALDGTVTFSGSLVATTRPILGGTASYSFDASTCARAGSDPVATGCSAHATGSITDVACEAGTLYATMDVSGRDGTTNISFGGEIVGGTAPVTGLATLPTGDTEGVHGFVHLAPTDGGAQFLQHSGCASSYVLTGTLALATVPATGWVTNGPAEASAVTGAKSSVLTAAVGPAAAAGDEAFDAAESVAGPSAEGGSGGKSCSATTDSPTSRFDDENDVAYIEVRTDVYCNFDSPEIVVKVILFGTENGHSVSQQSSDNYCYGASHCAATAYYSRALWCNEDVTWRYHGVPYGGFRKKSNGAFTDLSGSGVEGPEITGYGWHAC